MSPLTLTLTLKGEGTDVGIALHAGERIRHCMPNTPGSHREIAGI